MDAIFLLKNIGSSAALDFNETCLNCSNSG